MNCSHILKLFHWKTFAMFLLIIVKMLLRSFSETFQVNLEARLHIVVNLDEDYLFW